MSTERRSARRANRLTRRRPWLLPVLAGALVVAVIAGVAFAMSRVTTMSAKPVTKDAVPSVAASIPATDETTPTAAVATSTPAASAVEVPNVIGKPVSTGETVIRAAGLTTVTRVAGRNTPAVAANAVLSQDPPQGTKVPAGTVITLTYNPKPAPQAAPQAAPQTAATGIVVAIDPGHQAVGNNALEPIGPGSTTMKAKVASGASGVNAPHTPEYALTLATSLKLRDILRSQGITVVMIRESNTVNISNAGRAQMANRAHASLLVRVHFDGVSSQSTHGISTLYGQGNQWVDPYAASSHRAADLIGNAASAATGAPYRGAVAHKDMTGLNWATVPSMIIEGGFLSNPAEDAQVCTDVYQAKLAQGIANGVMKYLGR